MEQGSFALMEKIIKIQNELKVKKNKFNKFGNFNYRSAEDILEELKPLLKKHNLFMSFSDEIFFVEGRFYLKTILNIQNDSGEFFHVSAYARESETKSGMDMAQITGSCSSYARKYALNGLFLIDDSDDMDAKDNTEKQPELAPAAKKKNNDSGGSKANDRPKSVEKTEQKTASEEPPDDKLKSKINLIKSLEQKASWNQWSEGMIAMEFKRHGYDYYKGAEHIAKVITKEHFDLISKKFDNPPKA